jgi:hypothetical protein
MASMAGAAPWASGVLDSARTAWDVRPASTDLAPPGRGRYRSSAGLPPEAGSSVLPHSAPPGGPASRDPTGKTAGQCSFRWGERGDSNPRHPGPQQCRPVSEDAEIAYVAGIPGERIGIITPVERHLRPSRLPHFCPTRGALPGWPRRTLPRTAHRRPPPPATIRDPRRRVGRPSVNGAAVPD